MLNTICVARFPMGDYRSFKENVKADFMIKAPFHENSVNFYSSKFFASPM